MLNLFLSKLIVHSSRSSRISVVVYCTRIFWLFRSIIYMARVIETAKILGNSYCYFPSEKRRRRNKYLTRIWMNVKCTTILRLSFHLWKPQHVNIKNTFKKKKRLHRRLVLLQVKEGKGAMNVKETTWFILMGAIG